jgi:hypothetical protein
MLYLLIILLIIVLLYLYAIKSKEHYISYYLDKQKIGTNQKDNGKQPKGTELINGYNVQKCFGTDKVPANLIKRKGNFCDYGNDNEIMDQEALYAIELSNYDIHYQKKIKGKNLKGSYTAMGELISFNDGRTTETMTLDKSIKVCDSLGFKCEGFIFVETNQNELGYTLFLESIDRNDLSNQTNDVNYISYIKKGVMTNIVNNAGNNSSSNTSQNQTKPKVVEIIPKGKRFNSVDCVIPLNKEYDMLKTLGTLKECKDECINNPGCNGFSRQKNAGENDKAECILKKAFYNDMSICQDSNTHVSYVRDGQVEAERNYKAEQIRIQEEKARIEKEKEEKKRKEIICNKKLMPNNECIIMYGSSISVAGLVDYISVNNNDEKVYIKFDDVYTKMVCVNGESRYYNGPILDYKPCNWLSYTLAPNNTYLIKKGEDNECSKDCNWKSTNSCIFPSYNFNGGACISNNNNPTYRGLYNYSKDQLNSWLYALFDRDLGNSGGQTESKVVYDYWKKCKDVPGYGFLYNNNFEKIMNDNLLASKKIISSSQNINTINDSGKTYEVYIFTSNGTFQVGDKGSGTVNIELLLVGGGGGGSGGGGGAGEVVLNSDRTLKRNTRYDIIVGRGGNGTRATVQNGENGGTSYISGGGIYLEAIGGGGGGMRWASGSAGGSSGGSGQDTGNDTANSSKRVGWGNKGGKGPAYEGYVAGSGGGGASSQGTSGSRGEWRGGGWRWTQLGSGGNGGNGLLLSISGQAVWYGGGGGGGCNTNSDASDRSRGLGGMGGGGNGSIYSGNTPPYTGVGDNGQDGTGGGGGGGDYEGIGGKGGSGIVIIRIEKN